MIQFIDVSKSFRDQKVLDKVNLLIRPKETTVIIGQSGTGKTVLLKHMIALVRPDSGQVLVGGEDIGRQDEDTLNRIRKRFGMLFQDAALFDSMTVGENVAFPLKEHTDFSAKAIRRIAGEKLEQVGLADVYEKMPSELSGGMRKRAGLARAIALDPEIILFDEPTTGLDPIMRDAIGDLIVETQRRTQATCVVISHDIEGAFRMAHRIAMIHRGRIIEAGGPEEIRRSKNPIVRRFVGGPSDETPPKSASPGAPVETEPAAGEHGTE